MTTRKNKKQTRRVALLLMVSLVLALTLSATFVELNGSGASTAYAASEWAANVAYKVGDLVTYQGVTYKCLQAHTSQTGWEPPNVPALWQVVSGTPVPTNTPTATPRPTNTPTGPTATPRPTNTPTAGPTATPRPTSTPTPTATPGSGCTAPAYSNTQVYTGGMQATYNGHTWQAKWWTQGEAPSTGGSGVWTDLGLCSTGPTATPTATPRPTNTPTAGPTPTSGPTPTPPPPGSYEKVGYFSQWGIYGNAYYPKNLITSGAAANLTTLIYAFENIDPTNLTCFEAIKAASTDESNPNAGDGAGDAFADYQKSYDAGTSVDGVADTYNQPIRGNFNQLKKLKAQYPNLKILVSIGGWTYSKYFSDVAASTASRQKFVSSCIDMFIKGNLPQIGGDTAGGTGSGAGVFDGFDLDWEYPATAGHTGNHFGAQDTANFTALLAEFRSQFNALGGKHYYLTAAVASGQDKIAKLQTNLIGQYLDFIDLMSYDMHGAWDATGPTNFQAPIHDTASDPSQPIPPGTAKYNIDTSVKAWTQGLPAYNIPGGFPMNKIVLGIPFYARGWSGVTAGTTNGVYRPATGPSPQFSFSQTAGVAFWKELAAAGLTSNISWDSTTQSSYIFSGGNFYTFDSPQAIAAKDQYIKTNGMRGAMVFSMEGDDAQGTLFNAVANGLR